MDKSEFNKMAQDVYSDVYNEDHMEETIKNVENVLTNNNKMNALVLAIRDLNVEYTNKLVYQLVKEKHLN